MHYRQHLGLQHDLTAIHKPDPDRRKERHEN